MAGLNDGGVEDPELIVEATSYNESSAAMQSCVQDLLVKQQADIIIAPLNAGLIADLKGLASGQEVPIIALTMGEDIIEDDTAPPWVFVNSFNLWRSSWVSGWNAVQKFGKEIAIVLGAHEAGYGLAQAFSQGVEAARGAVATVTPLFVGADEDFASEQLEFALETAPDALFLCSSSQELELLERCYQSLEVRCPIVKLPDYLLWDPATDQKQKNACNDNHTTVEIWQKDSDDGIAFINKFSKETGRPAHPYAIMSYEAGLLTAAAVSANGGNFENAGFREKLAQVQAIGPRGVVSFANEQQEIVTTKFWIRSKNGTHAPFEPPALLEQGIIEARAQNDKQGWLNPYLVA